MSGTHLYVVQIREIFEGNLGHQSPNPFLFLSLITVIIRTVITPTTTTVVVVAWLPWIDVDATTGTLRDEPQHGARHR